MRTHWRLLAVLAAWLLILPLWVVAAARGSLWLAGLALGWSLATVGYTLRHVRVGVTRYYLTDEGEWQEVHRPHTTDPNAAAPWDRLS